MFKQTSIAVLGLVALMSASLAQADHRYKTQHKRWSRADAYQVSTYRPVQRVTRAGSDYDYARVIDVEPVIRHVTVRVPQRECWEEDVYYDGSRGSRGDGTAAATIAGGLIGGVIGRQIGGGSGRDAMTVVGTLVGSALAHERASQSAARYDDNYETRVDTVRRCETRTEVREEERIDGYRVTYLYNGKEYTTRTARDPGDRIKVRVSVTPERY